MVRDRKVLSFVANRVQVLYKAVSEPLLGLTDVEEATLGAADAIDHIGGCAGEPLSDVEGFFGSLDGGLDELQIHFPLVYLISLPEDINNKDSLTMRIHGYIGMVSINQKVMSKDRMALKWWIKLYGPKRCQMVRGEYQLLQIRVVVATDLEVAVETTL
eukprot:g39695.t1